MINRSWIGYRYLNKKEQTIVYDNIGINYKQGIIGIAYFYIKVYKITKNKYYLNLAKEVMSISNIESYIGIHKEMKGLATIYRILYNETKEKHFKETFKKLKITSSEYEKIEEKIKDIYLDNKCKLAQNKQGECFLGVDNGLAGLGLYIARNL